MPRRPFVVSIAVGSLTAAGVMCYELAKTLLARHLSLWESHLITVVSFSLAVPTMLMLTLRLGGRGRRLLVAALLAKGRGARQYWPPAGSFIARRVVLAGLVTCAGMSVYETAKQLVIPSITIWESHLMTIGFATLTSIVTAHVIFRRQASVNRQLAASLQEVRRAQSALRESEERHRSIVLNAGEGICVLDAEGRFLLSNPACDGVFGVSSGALIGRKFDDFVESSVPCEAESAAREVVQVTIVRPGGARRVLLVTSVPQHNGSMRICFDITQHQQATDALVRAQRLAALGTLAAGVAHEFNNVHFAVLGCLEITLRDTTVSARSRTRLTAARDAIDRAAGITRGLLAFSRAGVTQRTATSLNGTVTQVLDILQETLRSEGIEIRAELGDAPLLLLDGAQVSQVVMNLVINAQHAMLGRSVKQLELSTGREGARVFVRVRDSGCGIPAQDIPRLFLPFFTTKGDHARPGSASADVKGTGIGLSVCETIVHAHGGEIAVESVEGVGSTFTVWLPIVAPEVEVAARQDAGAEKDAAPAEEGPGRILVLDDSDIVRDVVSDMLGDAGHTVVATDDGAEALRLLAEQAFDVVMVDLQMPKMSGAEFLERLSRLPLPRRPLVLAMTGKAVEDNVKAYAGLGVAETLLKPFSQTTLEARISSALDEIRRRTGAASPLPSTGN